MIWVQIAWRNLRRQGRRSIITAAAMAVSVGLCMSSICLTDGVYKTMFGVMVEQQLGHIQMNHPDYPGKRSMYDTIDSAEEVLARVDGTDGVVAAAPKLLGFGLLGGPESSKGVQLMGIDPAREKRLNRVYEHVKTGSYLAPGDTGKILLGVKLAEDLEVAVGDEVVAVTQASDGSLGNALYTVAGTVRTGDTNMDRSGAYMMLADLQELLVLEGKVHQITVMAADPDALPPLVEELSTANPDLLVRDWTQVSPQTQQMLSMQDASSGIILIIVFLVASFGVVNTMLVSVFERTTELGVMRALGVSGTQLVQMVVVEAILLGALSAAGGLALGGALDAWLVVRGVDFSSTLPDGIDFQGITIDPIWYGLVKWEPIALTIALLILVSALAAVWPAMRAARIQPVEALRAD